MITTLPLRFLFLMTNTIGRVTLLLFLVAAVAFALRRSSASARHLIWAIGLAGLVLLFLLADRIPTIDAPIPQKLTSTFVRFPAGDESLAETLKRETLINKAAGPWGSDLPVASVPNLAINPELADDRPFIQIRETLSPVPLILMLVWLAGFVFVMARMATGLRALSRIRSASVEVAEGPLAEMLTESKRALDYRRNVRLFLASQDWPGLPPMTWGYWRPAILLPADTMEWPNERAYATLVHEMTHVRRNDFIWQMVAAFSCALFWFHPLSWWASEQMRAESEKACDDRVITHGMRAPEYASLLLDVARSIRCAGSPVAVALTMVRRPRIERRLRAVLDNHVTRHPVTRRAVTAIVAIASLLVLPLAAFQPVLRVQLPTRVEQPKDGIITADNNTATLDNDVKVELVGIADNGLRRQTWWKPNGDSLSSVPFSSEGWESKSGKPRMMALRLTYPTTSEPNVRAESPEGTGVVQEYGLSSFQEPVLPTEIRNNLVSEWRSITRHYGRKQESTDLLYGVAAGPWRTVASVDASLGSVPTPRGNVVFLYEWDSKKREYIPAEKDIPADQVQTRMMKCSVISVIDSEGDVERRVTVVDRRGREVPTQCVWTSYIGSRIRTTVVLSTEQPPSDSLLKDVRKVRLQIRPYRWVRFDHIALDPKGGIPPQPAPAPPASVRAVYYLSMVVTPMDPYATNDIADEAMVGGTRSAVFQTTLVNGVPHYLAALRKAHPEYRFAPIKSGIAKPNERGQCGFLFSPVLPGKDWGYVLPHRTDVQFNVDQTQQVNGSVTLESGIDSMAEDDAETGRPPRTVKLGWDILRLYPNDYKEKPVRKVANVLLNGSNVLECWGNPMDPGEPSYYIVACPVQ